MRIPWDLQTIGGAYSQLYDAWDAFLSLQEQCVLSKIANIIYMTLMHARQHPKSWKKRPKRERRIMEEGWVPMPTKTIMGRLETWDRRRIETQITKLKQQGILRTRLVGVPPKRWVYIDTNVLRNLCDAFSSNYTTHDGNHDTSPIASRNRQSNCQSELAHVCQSKQAILRVKKNTEKTCRAGGATEWSSLGDRLKHALEEHRKIPHTAKPSQWGRYFKQIHTMDGVPVERIEKALKWYCQRLHEDGDINVSGRNVNGVPVMMSGRAFRQKFPQLEAAMTRLGAAHQPEKRLRVREEAMTPEEIREMNRKKGLRRIRRHAV